MYPSISLPTNPYLGINPHLHSQWQGEGGWDEFHTSYIVFLANALKAILLPLGYTAGIEQSLQIRRFGEPVGRPEADITIYDADPARQSSPSLHTSIAQQVLSIPEMFQIHSQDLADYRAVVIYQFDKGRGKKGEPVTWLELLSPSNKPGGQDSVYYRDKRQRLLESGLVFIELDFLHESPSTFETLPNYPANEPSASPYNIIVIDPRPQFLDGEGYIYAFGVDEPFPDADIPLSGDETIRFNFGAPYQKTLQDSFFLDHVDYQELPHKFDRYQESDQAKILTRLLDIHHHKGIDYVPNPLEALPVDVANEAWINR